MSRKKVAALILAAILAALCLSTTAMGSDVDEYKAQLNDLTAKYDELEKQQAQIQKSIDKAKTEKEKQQAVKQQLDSQISGVRQQISLLADKVELMENNIAAKQLEYDEQNALIDENYDLLKRRLRAMYTTGNASVLGLMLGAEDFSEFLTRSEVAARVAERDQMLIAGMRRELSAIQAVREEIERDKREVEQAREQMADKQSQLGGQLSQAQSQLQDIVALEQQYKANQAKLEREMKEVQDEVDEIYKTIQSIGEYDGAAMLWPVAGYMTVTSDYGWRFGGADFHTGVDIARLNAAGQGIYGKPILAAADGRVAFTQTNYVQGRGYGIFLMLDHGSGVSTLYGHTSGLAVKVGDTVKRGQTIAYVGSTGWSTGPHLHFEVRVNGAHVSPWTYLRK